MMASTVPLKELAESLDTFWRVDHTADTTETGLPMNRTYVRVTWVGYSAQHNEQPLLEEWAHEQFGSRVAFVQGVAAVPEWTLHKIDEAAWREAKPIVWGGHPTRTAQLHLRLGRKSSADPWWVDVGEMTNAPEGEEPEPLGLAYEALSLAWDHIRLGAGESAQGWIEYARAQIAGRVSRNVRAKLVDGFYRDKLPVPETEDTEYPDDPLAEAGEPTPCEEVLSGPYRPQPLG